MSASLVEVLLPLLLNAAPSHVFYLIYDDTFKDPDVILRTYTEVWGTSTVMKFTEDMAPLMRALADPLTLSSTSRRHILVLCSKARIEDLFIEISLRNLENPDTWWIVMIESEEELNFLQEILREGSQVIIMQKENSFSFKFLSSAVDRFGIIRFHAKGRWTENSPYNNPDLFKSMFVDLEKQYSDFKGRQLTVTINSLSRVITLKKMFNGTLVLESGYEASLLRALSDALNFTLTIRSPEDGKWGDRTSNGSVTGLIGDVFRRDAHFTIFMTVTESRESVVDFTVPYTMEGLTLVSQAPKEKSRVLAALSPFTPEVWLSIGIIIVVVGMVLSAQAWISNTHNPEKLEGYSLENVLFNITRSILKQNNFLTAKGSTNISLILVYIFALILSVLYSGMLIATLTRPSFEKHIDSLHDLPEAVAKGYTLVTVGDSILEYTFKFAPEGIYTETWKLFNHEDRSKSFVPISKLKLNRVLTEKVIFVESEKRAKLVTKGIGPHLVHLARDSFGFRNIGIGCFMGAPFKKNFNQVLQRMVEGGLVEKWFNDEYLKISSSITDDKIEDHNKAFTVMQLQAAFYIVFLGYILAGIVLAVELCFKIYD